MRRATGRRAGCRHQTGGWGYFLEEGEGYEFPPRVNKDVNMQRVPPTGAAQLRGIIEEHLEATGSAKAKAILDNWDEYLPRFWQVYPSSEKDAPEVSGLVEAEKVAVAS